MDNFNITSAEPATPLPPPRLVHPDRQTGRRGLRRFMRSLSPQAWSCIDALIIALAACATHTVLFLSSSQFGWVADPWLASVAFCGSFITAGLVFGLYERQTLLERSRILLRSALTLGLGVVLAFAFLTVIFYAQASRWVGLTVGLAYALVAIPLRLYAHEVITAARVRLLCIGTGASMRKLVNMLGTHNRHYEVIGHIRVEHNSTAHILNIQAHKPAPRFWSEEELQFEQICPQLGNLDQVATILHTEAVDEVIVGTEFIANPEVGHAVSASLEARCRITDQTTFVEKLLGEVPAENIAADWFLKADVHNRASYDGIKRLMDATVATLGILISAPLWPLIALAVRLDSTGPALYRQTRVGQYGRCFTMYKFRTMRQDAEKDGAKWADHNDPRVTRLGRFLRRSRLDEIPQLWNIVRGDMSLVGPRPERPEFVRNLEQLLPHYRLRHLIKPGLTGWAQIRYRYGSSIADAHKKLCYDLYYLKHRSIDTDLSILIRTAGTFLLGSR